MECKEGVKDNHLQHMCVAAFFGAAVALVSCCVFLLLFSLVVIIGWIPASVVGGLVPLGCFISALAGGGIAVRKGIGAPLVLGLATGVVMCTLILLLGFTAFDMTGISLNLFLAMTAAMVGAGIAGFCRPNKKVRRKLRHR